MGRPINRHTQVCQLGCTDSQTIQSRGHGPANPATVIQPIAPFHTSSVHFDQEICDHWTPSGSPTRRLGRKPDGSSEKIPPPIPRGPEFMAAIGEFVVSLRPRKRGLCPSKTHLTGFLSFRKGASDLKLGARIVRTLPVVIINGAIGDPG